MLVELLVRFIRAVLRRCCLSVDEPVRGSTPALAIHGSLVTATAKHAMNICIGRVDAIPVIHRADIFRY